MATTSSYYSFERVDGDGSDGLIRFDGGTLERAAGGRWIEDLDLARHIFFPGGDGLEVIDKKTALELASRYGVEL